MAGENLQRAELAILSAADSQPDQRHEHGDERHGHGERDGGDPVGGADGHDDGDRHDDGEHELRQVPREVAVERVDAVRRQRRQLTDGLPVAGRPSLCDLLDERLTQL